MNVHYFFFGILMIFLISLPIVAFWFWKKEESIKFLKIPEFIWKKWKLYILIFISIIISEFFIPFNKNHGIEYNTERKHLGIPTIGNNWKVDDHYSEQFETHWWKPKPRNGHFKKVIEYGIFNAKSETDYYQNEKIKGTFAWSKYDFNKNTFEYFLEKPNENKISITKKGKVKYEKPKKIVNISQIEFENYINK